MIKVIMPVYWVQKRKTKADKTELLGMNWYRNAHFQDLNKCKKELSNYVNQQLMMQRKKITEQYEVHYTYFYKNNASDLMNVVSLSSKIVNDCLQEMGIVVNDNVQYCIRESAVVGGMDKENPRCEIIIKPATCFHKD